MKRTLTILAMALLSCTSLLAMTYERAREEALFLTDKMAYELNLSDQQYDYAYEINLDYFMSMDCEADLYGHYLDYRLTDLRCILHDWQYTLMMATNYFVRPLVWRSGCWHFPIYTHYTGGHFFFRRPSVYISYRGGHSHSHFHVGFYSGKRPEWRGGLRGKHPISAPQGHRVSGNGYSFSVPSHNGRPSAPRGGNVENGRTATPRGGSVGSSKPSTPRGTSAGSGRGDSFKTSSTRSTSSYRQGGGAGRGSGATARQGQPARGNNGGVRGR